MRKFGWAVIAGVLAGCVPASEDSHTGNQTGLEFFADEAEFRAFVAELQRRAGARLPSNCDECETITVTGSRIAAPSNPEITNNQVSGVDEGGIVKQIGDYLIILQDGRLYSVDIASDTGEPLRVADRINVYRDPSIDTWIDEVLVAGDRIIVTEYSYELWASGYSLFTLDEAGQFHRGETYYVRSSDYFSSDNYASRIMDGRLVFYIPLRFYDFWRWVDKDEPIVWPGIASWSQLRAADPGDPETWPTEPLVRATDILKPLDPGPVAALHLIVSCEISEGLDCSAVGVPSSPGGEYYVHNDAFYLWTYGVNGWAAAEPTGLERHAFCRPDGIVERAPVNSLHRLPVDGSEPSAIRVPGMPGDQFAMSVDRGRFRALAAWEDEACEAHFGVEDVLALVDIPVADMARRGQVRPEQVELLPRLSLDTGWGDIHSRFTETHLAYARSAHWQDYPPRGQNMHEPAHMMLVPLGRPSDAHAVEVEHGAIRLDRLGDDFLMTGYRTGAGLHLSVIEPGQRASQVRATTRLMNRFESENRSHAFNYTFDEDGVLMGLPSVKRPRRAGRWWWSSDSSDLSLLRLDDDNRFSRPGDVEVRSDETGENSSCEVSCTDWYGNTRPIFTAGRVFALMGKELVEVDVSGDYLRELARIDLDLAGTEPVAGPAGGSQP
jgi:hypothetical protein